MKKRILPILLVLVMLLSLLPAQVFAANYGFNANATIFTQNSMTAVTFEANGYQEAIPDAAIGADGKVALPTLASAQEAQEHDQHKQDG